MVRVRIIVEGQTEEAFVQGPLYHWLAPLGVFLEPTLIGVPGKKRGRVTFERVRDDVTRTLRQDHSVYCSTLIDLYGIGGGFPQQPGGSADTSVARVEHLEASLAAEIQSNASLHRPELRFSPYVQMHEFEGLLFSDPSILADGMFRPDLGPQLGAIRAAFPTPEDINDGPASAPSKRLIALDGRYEKVISGFLAAEQMGVAVIKEQCPRFRTWVDRLATLGTK